jgi:nucleoside-diphosphate-sugar epimerase
MSSAFVLGGTGFVGQAVARRLAGSGWDVTVGSRGLSEVPEDISSSCRFVQIDRTDTAAIRRAVRGGVDVFVDIIPYERRDAEQLVGLKDLAGSVVAISSASVYADDEGRTLDEAETAEDFPRLPNPIPETQSTAAPGDDTYSTKKVAIEEILLGQGELPATVVRPCAIYGPDDTLCREWFFVKRALDRRPFVLLAHEGMSFFHTTSVHNLAELVRLAAQRPGTRVLNCGDPDPPNVLRIARRIATALGHERGEIPIPPELSEEPFVRNPWAAPKPFVLDMTKARDELGYQPVVTYEDAIVETVEWVISVAGPDHWREALPKAADYLSERFDYEAEDSFIRSLGELPT